MMDVLFDHHHFLSERETPSSEMKVSGGSDYKQGWSFPEGEGKGFVGSRTTEAELVSSSESTEEDDDYIAELTRQMTHYMLQDDDKHALKTSITSSEKNEESWGCVGWQSNSMTMWSPLGSSSGSPEGPSEESSPPVTPGKDKASEHKSPPSYAAVLCKLDKLETNKQGSPSGTTQVAEAENPKQGVAFDQSQDSKINLKLTHGRSTKKQSSVNNGRQPKHITHQTFESYNLNHKKVGSDANGGLRASPPIVNLSSNLWLNNQQGPSNKRAVFLGVSSGAGARVGTPSCGTGVFLPCVIGNTSQSPKNKRGCAPVLIPAKVVQALKVHFDRVGDLPRQNPTAFPIQNDSSKSGRRTSLELHSSQFTVPFPVSQLSSNHSQEEIEEMAEQKEIQIPKVKLGTQGFEVSKLGFGCMGLTFVKSPGAEEDGISIIKHAFSKGITFFDTSDIYGTDHANEILVGKALKQLPREEVQLATKFGVVSLGPPRLVVKGTPEYVRSCCEASLKRLGVDYIDLYYYHRIDQTVPIEDTMGELKKLVEEGKIKYIGLSEASPDTIRRAHAVHPITAVQMEWSLWTRDIEEEIIPLCRERGIGIVPYSPLGRGFFAGKAVVESLDPNVHGASHPRLTGENLEKNRHIYQAIESLATNKHHCSPAQLALSWVLHQGDDVVPIPGTTKIKNLDTNIGSLSLNLKEDDLKEITEAVPLDEVAGEKTYPSASHVQWKYANTPQKTLN